MRSVISKKTHEDDSKEFDLNRLFGALIDHYKLVSCITFALTSLAIIYVIFASPIYKADALIQVEQKQGNAILDSISQVLPETQPQSEPEIALLQSRMILGETIDDLNLQIEVSQKYFPIFGRGLSRLMGENKQSIEVSKLFVTKSNSDTPEVELTIVDKTHYRVSIDSIDYYGQVGVTLEKPQINILVNKIDAVPDTKFSLKYSSKLDVINDLQKSILVADQGKDTGMLTLSMMGSDPVKISQILNSVSNNYLAQNIARQAAQNEKSLEFLQIQLPKVRADLDNSENKMNAYRRQKDSIDLSLEAKSILDQIVNVDNQLNQLTFREAEISQLFTKEHPTYKALLEKRQILQDEKNKLSKQVSAMPVTQQEVLRLSRDVESGRAVYMQLLNRQQELEIAKSSAIGNVRIIDQAVTEPKPVKPNKAIIVAISFILSLVLSVIIVVLKEFLHKGIETPQQIENLGVNVFSSIPNSEWMEKNNNLKTSRNNINNVEKVEKILAIDNPADIAIEAIRSLRTSLYFAMMESSNNVLMISGPTPGAGKSFISANLAVVMGQLDKKVLLIDGDMRKGFAHKVMGISDRIGLSNILTTDIPYSEAVNIISRANIDFIGRGKVPSNPAELLMSPRFSKLIEWATKNYDLVVIDSPPILAVTDAAIIGRHAGTNLIVARFEDTTTKDIELSLSRFQQSGVSINGCILNGIIKRHSSYYNYYGYEYTSHPKSK